jgi:hypothetical protein
MTFKNGNIHKGQYQHGEIVTGKTFFTDGTKFQGKMKNDVVMDGFGIYTFTNSSTLTATWDNGKIIGNGILEVNFNLYSDIYDCTYENGKIKKMVYVSSDYTYLIILIIICISTYCYINNKSPTPKPENFQKLLKEFKQSTNYDLYCKDCDKFCIRDRLIPDKIKNHRDFLYIPRCECVSYA